MKDGERVSKHCASIDTFLFVHRGKRPEACEAYWTMVVNDNFIANTTGSIAHIDIEHSLHIRKNSLYSRSFTREYLTRTIRFFKFVIKDQPLELLSLSTSLLSHFATIHSSPSFICSFLRPELSNGFLLLLIELCANHRLAYKSIRTFRRGTYPSK